MSPIGGRGMRDLENLLTTTALHFPTRGHTPERSIPAKLEEARHDMILWYYATDVVRSTIVHRYDNTCNRRRKYLSGRDQWDSPIATEGRDVTGFAAGRPRHLHALGCWSSRAKDGERHGKIVHTGPDHNSSFPGLVLYLTLLCLIASRILPMAV